MKELCALLLMVFLVACGQGTSGSVEEPASRSVKATETEAVDRYHVAGHFPGAIADTLLANMITFIFKRPTAAINRDRTHAEFRSYYVSKLDQFEFVHHHMSADSTHWFYVIRPARNVDGDKRGVGGKFRTNEALEMVEFEEIFNTPVMPKDQLEQTGRILFEEMIATGNVDAFTHDRKQIEWPDERLKYDTEKREWRYDVVENGSTQS